LTGLNNCSGLDRRIMTVLAAIGVTVAVFGILCFRCSLDWLFWAPFGTMVVMRVVARTLDYEERKVAQEPRYVPTSRPILSFFRKAGPIDGAPFRAWSPPLNVGDVIGYIS